MTIFGSLVRAVHIASCMLLQGNLVFRLFVAGPVCTRAGDNPPSPVFVPLQRQLHKLTAWTFVVGFLSGCLWPCSVAAGISGANSILALQPDTLRVLMEQTQFGLLWKTRLALAVGFGGLFFVKKQWSQVLQLLFAVAMLISLSLGGHASAAVGEWHWIHVGDDAIHLAAAGVWPAGLAPFAIFLTQALQFEQIENVRNTSLITQRFSTLSLSTVGALTITGLINGYFLVGTFHALFTTIYGRLVVLKIAVFGAMILIGAVNLFWVKPRIILAVHSVAIAKSLDLLRFLRRNVLAELFLGAILIIVVGVLGLTPPAAHSNMPSGGATSLQTNFSGLQASHKK